MSTFLTWSGDIEPVPGSDLTGFTVPSARVELTGGREGYNYTISYDLSGSALQDAFIEFPIGSVTGRAGAFKAPVVSSGLRDRQDLFFADRSVIGQMWSGRQAGFGLSGAFDQLNWHLGVQNGADGVADEFLLSLRGEFTFMGKGSSYEGVGGTVAAAFYDDGAIDEGDGFAVEANLATSTYSFGLEVLDIGEGGGPGTGNDSGAVLVALPTGADSTPFALSGTYMLTENEWEIGLRFQDLDDADDSDKIDLAVNHYNDGHDLKWTMQYTTTSSDDATAEVDLFLIGLTLGF
jgi:hypothetical protein